MKRQTIQKASSWAKLEPAEDLNFKLTYHMKQILSITTEGYIS